MDEIKKLSKKVDRRNFELALAREEFEVAILTAIARGEFKSDYTNLTLQMTLQTLRKRGGIINEGTRKHPKWVLVH